MLLQHAYQRKVTEFLLFISNDTLAAFFKIVVTSCLLIKQPLFQDLDERHQLVYSS